MIDRTESEEVARQRGRAIKRFDWLKINKTDFALKVGASLQVMQVDCVKMRSDRPYAPCTLWHGNGIKPVIDFVAKSGGLIPD